MTTIPNLPGWPTTVRVYECDALGHVNNAVYLHYIQQATAEAWGDLASACWELRRLSVEYLAPAFSGDALEVVAWADGLDGGCPVCGYVVRRATGGQPLTRARAVWAWQECVAEEPHIPTLSWPVDTPADLSTPKPLRLPADVVDGQVFHWEHAVRRYELNINGNTNPVEILRWLEEAKFAACAGVGWPVERILAEDCIIVQLRHDAEFFSPLQARDRVEILSRVCHVRQVRGTWEHRIYRAGELVALDYSTGAFLNGAGHPRLPPQAMLEALLQGE